MKNCPTTSFATTIAVAASVAAATAAAQNEPLFDAPWRAFDTGDFPEFAPTFMTFGDLDLDGDLDAVVGREFFGAPGISVLLSHGDGTFAPPDLYTLPHSKDVQDVGLADFDRDGDLDVYASIPGTHGTNFRFAVWPNNTVGGGDRTLGDRREFITGLGPIGIVVDDFNGDGFPDVVTANEAEDTVALHLHNTRTGAQANYQSPQFVDIGANTIRVEAADLDGDDDLDVVVGRGSFVGIGGTGVSILFNEGGSFAAPVHYQAIQNVYRFSPAVHLADMDQDGDIDILAAGATNGSPSYGVVAILRNNGAGEFTAEDAIRLEAWTFTPWQLLAADLNDDSAPDIIASTPSGRANDGFNVLMANALGGYTDPIRYQAAKQTFDLAALDLDDDGDLDMVTAANDSSVLTVHLNQGDGTYPVPPGYDVGVLTRDMVEGDIDRDGDLDLVSGGNEDVHILRNRGDGTFAPAERFDTPFAPSDILLDDMNNDGWLDLVIRGTSFAVALNDGSGSFLPAVVTPTGSSQVGEIGVFDLDNDDDLDVVANDPGPLSRVYLFRNHGNGVTFSLANIIADDDGLPFGVGGGDFDHDGKIDLLFDNALGLTVYLGNGDFTVRGPEPTSESGYPFRVADFNNDSHLDIAFQFPQDSFGTVFVGTMLGFGDGGFDFPQQEMPGPNGREGAFRISSDLDVFDVDRDGKLDLILTSNAPNDVSIFRGNGDGTIQDHERYGAGYSASDSAIGDFNDDGLIDIATVAGLPPSGLDDKVVMLFGLEREGEPQEAELAEVTIIDGVIISGGLAQIRDSDNTYLETEARVTGEVHQPHLLRLRIAANSNVQNPSSQTITIEGRITDVEAQTTLLLRDWVSGGFVQVDQFSMGMQEETHETDVPNTSRFIRASDGAIELEVKQIVFFPFTLNGFHTFFDHVEMTVR